MSDARVSIIIPTFNRAQLLPRAVASAFAAGENPEVIIVDDASTDATPEICRNLRDVRIIRHDRNQGLGAARNTGIRASRGQYIALLDDDDRRMPDSLAPQVDALEANPEAALCYGRVFLGDCATGETTNELIPKELPRGDLFWKLLRGNFIPALSVLLRREPLFAAGLFHPRLREVEDWDLWLRLSERASFTAVETPVAVYRMFDQRSGQLSSNRARMAVVAATIQGRATRRARAAREPARARACREKFLRETRYTLLHETIDALSLGQKKTARATLFAIFRFLPTSLGLEEFRELVRLTSSRQPAAARAYAKRLKAVRKKLWARPPPA